MSLRVEFGELPVPSYYEPPGTVVVDVERWRRLCSCARVELLAREAAHHVALAVYPARPRGWQRVSAARLEERGRRLALRVLVDDREVLAAAVAGVSEPWELAERWGRSPRWCAARVALWRVERPELAAWVGPL